jgi:hypothetical protein
LFQKIIYHPVKEEANLPTIAQEVRNRIPERAAKKKIFTQCKDELSDN